MGGNVAAPFPARAGMNRLPAPRTFWPSLTSVICLEKLRALSLGPMTLFQRPICVSIRLALVVPCCRLPGHAAVAADLGNMGYRPDCYKNLCPDKAGMFSGGQTHRGKSQSPVAWVALVEETVLNRQEWPPDALEERQEDLIRCLAEESRP